jgi:pre-rRNA-processing protein TSR4
MDLDGADEAGSSGGAGKEDKQVYESTMDSAFQKFADRVGQNPEQCIRYEYGGSPLLYAKGDEVAKIFGDSQEGKVRSAKSVPRCANCGAGRIFEVQLMPHAIEQLESEEDGLDGMDWGTVVVAVCEKDCVERGQKTGEAGYLEEWAGVQWEELTVKR